MEIIFYCSYTNSEKGFRMTRLGRGKLEICSLIGSKDRGELLADRFFSFDRFRILWQEIMSSIPGEAPVYTGGMFGIRDLKGSISDRSGVMNFAIIANDGRELGALQRVATAILADIEKFRLTVFSMMSIGGEAGYSIDAAAFMNFLKYLESEAPKEPPFFYTVNKNTVTDLLRFAVCRSPWNEAVQTLDTPALFKDKMPKQVISDVQYSQLTEIN